MRLAPPLRFLVLVFGTWTAIRVVAVTLRFWPEPALPPAPGLERGAPPVVTAAAAARPEPAASYPLFRSSGMFLERALPSARAKAPARLIAPSSAQSALAMAAPRPFVGQPEPGTASPLALPPPKPRRWSGSAWLLARPASGSALAPGGTLGGSQAGLRLNYALAPKIALSSRAYLPVDEPGGAEVALGFDWQPATTIPLHLLIERRQAVGEAGRSAFSLTAYGGVSERPVAGPVRLDAYAQGGMVGLHARDLFVDGSAKLYVRQGRAKIGAGLWGAAQPGARRIDAGPHLSVDTPVGTLAAEWRFRVGGEAHPGSGPALTIGRDF